jgi:hypothetical protein
VMRLSKIAHNEKELDTQVRKWTNHLCNLRRSSATIVQHMTTPARGDVAIEDDELFPRQPVRIGCAGWAIPKEDGIAYFRLHGSPHLYYSEYSEDFLNGLAAQLADLATQARVWCIFDNTAAGFAMQNALALTAKLKEGHWTDFLASCGD